MFMALWPGWKRLSPQQQTYVMDCAYLIAVQMIGGNAEGFDGKAIKGTMCDDFAEKLLSPIFGPITRGVDNAPVNGKSQITDFTLSRWRFTIFNPEIKAELLRRLEHDRQEVDRKEAASLERQEKKAEGERAKKAKADHLASPEGQRDAEVTAKKKSERATSAALGKAFRAAHPGKQYRPGKPAPAPLTCSYCKASYADEVGDNREMWKLCASVSCANQCGVISCMQSSRCCAGYDQHMSRPSGGVSSFSSSSTSSARAAGGGSGNSAAPQDDDDSDGDRDEDGEEDDDDMFDDQEDGPEIE